MHKKILPVIIIAVSILLFSSTLLNASTIKPCAPHHALSVGFSGTQIEYSETDMQEEGFMGGIYGNYCYHGNHKIMITADAEYMSGELDYDGQTWGERHIRADTDDTIIELRGLVGFDCYVQDSILITPFIGMGYRSWNDTIKTNGGYERAISYWYTPIGIAFINSINNAWRWELNAEYDIFWEGTVKSYLSDVSPYYSNPLNKQDFGMGYGLRFSARLIKEINNYLGVSIEPFIRYWNIRKSDLAPLDYHGTLTNYVYEPPNKTTSFGIRLGLSF